MFALAMEGVEAGVLVCAVMSLVGGSVLEGGVLRFDVDVVGGQLFIEA